jgi:hypothetical protein
LNQNLDTSTILDDSTIPMRKFFTVYIPPLIGVILILIKLPNIETWLKEKSTHSDFYIGVLLIGTTILTHFITVISPFKKYEKLEKNKWILIDNITSDRFLGQRLFPGYHLVANIMVPKRVFFSKLEPCKAEKTFDKIKCFKKSFFKKLLKPIWLSPEHSMNKKFKLTTNQGVSGRAFSEGVAALVNIPVSIKELNLNEKQMTSISGNGFVISYPIFAFDEKYNRLGTKIIGVVTLSCNQIGSELLIDNLANRQTLTRTVVEFSKVCSLIL